MNCFIL